MEKRISEFISYEEGMKSATAIRHGIDNTPPIYALRNMELVATNLFDPIRKFVGHPVFIHGFYRCPLLNKKLGGSRKFINGKWVETSQHVQGQAIDWDDLYGHTPNRVMYYWAARNLRFDQLIWEFGDASNPAWIHGSYKLNGNRQRLTLAYKEAEKTMYMHFTNLADFTSFKDQIYK